MPTNGAGQGLLAEDWDVTPGAPAHLATAQTASELSSPPAELSPMPPVPRDPTLRAERGLVLPDGVALMLDTALHGDRAPNGAPGADGRPRSKNLTVLIGTVRVATAGGARRIFTSLGAAEYRYELSINEVVGDEQSAARASYRLPISMSDAVRARYEHLLVDGQRIALLGPLGMEEYYDSRFQRDAYDAGRRTWDIRIDVLAVQGVGEDVPDVAWVQLEGEVVDRPRVYPRQYGDRRSLVEHYAGVTLRYREVLASSVGRAVRPVVKLIPVEVLVSPDEEIIPCSDALLRPGNKVRIEGRLSPSTFRLPRAALEDSSVQTALHRTRTQFETRNADLAQRAEATRQQRQSASKPAQTERRPADQRRRQPLDTEALERQIARAQQRLLTGRRVRVEVGYVELLHGVAATSDERARLIADAGDRRRANADRRPAAEPPDHALLQAAQDDDTVRAMQAADQNDEGAGAVTDTSEPQAGPARPRRPRLRAPEADGEPDAS